MVSRGTVAALILGGLIPGSVRAGETIIDPENRSPPTTEGADDGEGAGQAEDGDDGDDGGEATDAKAADGEGAASSGDDESEGRQTSFRGRWSGALGVDTGWVASRNEDIVEWQGGVDLRLEHDFNFKTRVVLEGEFRHWIGGRENPGETDLLVNAARPRASARAVLGEAYVVHRSDNWMVRAGNLVTRWGATDLVRPGDVVNASDLRDVSPGAGGGTKVPQPALEVARVEPNWSLTAVVVPFFQPNRVTVFGRDLAVAVPQNPLVGDQFPVLSVLDGLVDRSLYEEAQPLALAASQPDELPKNLSAGLRFEGTRWNTDFGAGYFFGWDRTPWLRVDEDLREFVRLVVEDGRVLSDFDFAGFIGRNPEAVELANRLGEKRRRGVELIESEYRRRHTFLVDVARYVGPIGLRADVSFSPERTFVTRGLDAVRRPTLFGAVGASWERLSADRPLVLTVEGFWLHPFDRDAGITEAFVDDRERGAEGAELAVIGEELWGVAAAFNWTLPWELELQLGAVVTGSNRDVVATGRIRKTWTGWLHTGIGATIFEGPDPAEELSLGGIYDRNDQVIVTVGGRF